MPVREADRSLSRIAACVVVGVDQVRRQQDVVVLQPALQRRQRAPGRRCRDPCRPPRRSPSCRPGGGRALHRRADLDHVVLEQPALEVRDAEVAGPDQPVERLGRRVEHETLRRLVGDQRRQFPVGMVLAQRLEQHPRAVQVREGEAGVAEDLHALGATARSSGERAVAQVVEHGAPPSRAARARIAPASKAAVSAASSARTRPWPSRATKACDVAAVGTRDHRAAGGHGLIGHEREGLAAQRPDQHGVDLGGLQAPRAWPGGRAPALTAWNARPAGCASPRAPRCRNS